MRLFYAILFERVLCDLLQNKIAELKSISDCGNFTRRENLHLTLVFIGEAGNAGKYIDVLNRIDTPVFELNFHGLGRFRRDGSDIYWAGVRVSEPLRALYAALCEELKKTGFKPDYQEYTPHITLGREVVIPSAVDRERFLGGSFSAGMTVTRVSLMNSARESGVLVYREIAGRDLE